MKLLMFYSPEFWIRPFEKIVPEAPPEPVEETFRETAVIFYHVEAEDLGAKRAGVVVKFIRNAKWLAGKFGTRRVVLHSFNHLSLSKASPDGAAQIRDEVRRRLEKAGFDVFETSFGWQNEWRLHVSGDSRAKVFKEF